MRIFSAAAIAVTALALSSCVTTTSQVSDSTFRPPEGAYRLIVMQPDISCGVLTAGGAIEHREDWTETARGNVLEALRQQQNKRGADVTIAATRAEMGGDPAVVSDLLFLHQAVGNAIKQHKYSMVPLPTKKDKFDWTLGEEAIRYGADTHYDYALFLHAEDSFASGGRVALQVASAIGCAFGVCAMPTGGMQIAFVSLVDLKTGQVVWFNTLAAAAGDIRTPQGATKMVDTLLDKMQAGKPPKTKGKAAT